LCRSQHENAAKCIWRPRSARTHWERKQCSPDLLAGFKGLGQGQGTRKGEKTGEKGIVEGGNRMREGRGTEGRMDKGEGRRRERRKIEISLPRSFL